MVWGPHLLAHVVVVVLCWQVVVGEGEVDETVVVLVLVVFLALNSLFQMTHILLKLVERIFSCLFLFLHWKINVILIINFEILWKLWNFWNFLKILNKKQNWNFNFCAIKNHIALSCHVISFIDFARECNMICYCTEIAFCWSIC